VASLARPYERILHRQVKQAEALFGSLPTKSVAAPPKAVYKGGEFRYLPSHHRRPRTNPNRYVSWPPDAAVTAASFGGDADAHLTTVAVALEGVSWSDTELYAACVLHTLMGGGGSFSAGNPLQPEPALLCTKQPRRTSALSKRASLGRRHRQGLGLSALCNSILIGAFYRIGGPGKGMHSRLYRNVLNQYHWVQSATAFNTCYSDSG
jgi:hypothetical protein